MAVAALKRARTRIGINGWGQGSSSVPQRGAHRVGAIGWCLEDAVRGRGRRQVDGSAQSYAEGEAAALQALEAAIDTLHPEEMAVIEASNPPSVVVAWNDTDGRTKDEVVAVVTLAMTLT